MSMTTDPGAARFNHELAALIEKFRHKPMDDRMAYSSFISVLMYHAFSLQMEVFYSEYGCPNCDLGLNEEDDDHGG